MIAKGEHALDDTDLETYIKNWLYNVKQLTLKPTSFDRAESTIFTHIIPRLGHYKICDLNGKLIQIELINYMLNNTSESTGKVLSFSSINKAYVYLNACLQYAIVNRKLLFNPCASVVLPNQKNKRLKLLDFSMMMKIKNL